MKLMVVFFVFQTKASYGHTLTEESIERMEWRCAEQKDDSACLLLGEEGTMHEPEHAPTFDEQRQGFLYFVQACNMGNYYGCDLVGYFLLRNPEITNYSGDPRKAAKIATFYLKRACKDDPQMMSSCTLMLEAKEKYTGKKVSDREWLEQQKTQCYIFHSAVDCIDGAKLAIKMRLKPETYTMATLACLRGIKEGCDISDRIKKSISK